ncbi:MAG: VOC family protein [Acidobacteria bacterium]|nr:VOC family protein [Acidobacteriota bacterium]
MRATAPVQLARIGQIAVNVHDVARAVEFYRDTLGMRFLFQAPPKLAFFDCGGIRLMLSVAEKPEFEHAASIIYYQVDDIQAAYRALRGAGVSFEGEPHLIAKLPDHDLWMAFFQDPDANLLALMSEVRPPQ